MTNAYNDIVHCIEFIFIFDILQLMKKITVVLKYFNFIGINVNPQQK